MKVDIITDSTLLARASSHAALWGMSVPEVTLDAPDSAAAGETIVFTVVLANRSDSSLDVHLQGREITFDVTVVDQRGEVVWHRLADTVTQAILRLDTFAPGESRSFSCEWDQRAVDGTVVERGLYFAQAVVPSETTDLESNRLPLELT